MQAAKPRPLLKRSKRESILAPGAGALGAFGKAVLG